MPSPLDKIVTGKRLGFVAECGPKLRQLKPCILSFFRRSKSRYAGDKAVDGFERVVEQTQILSGNERTSELASLIAKDYPTPAELKRIGKLLGGP